MMRMLFTTTMMSMKFGFIFKVISILFSHFFVCTNFSLSSTIQFLCQFFWFLSYQIQSEVFLILQWP